MARNEKRDSNKETSRNWKGNTNDKKFPKEEKSSKPDPKLDESKETENTTKDSKSLKLTLTNVQRIGEVGNPVQTYFQSRFTKGIGPQLSLVSNSIQRAIDMLTVERGYVTSVTATVVQNYIAVSNRALQRLISLWRIFNARFAFTQDGKRMEKPLAYIGTLNFGNFEQSILDNNGPVQSGTTRFDYQVLSVTKSKTQWYTDFLSHMSNLYVPKEYVAKALYIFGNVFKVDNEASETYVHYLPMYEGSLPGTQSAVTFLELDYAADIALLQGYIAAHPDITMILRGLGFTNEHVVNLDLNLDPIRSTMEPISDPLIASIITNQGCPVGWQVHDLILNNVYLDLKQSVFKGYIESLVVDLDMVGLIKEWQIERNGLCVLFKALEDSTYLTPVLAFEPFVVDSSGDLLTKEAYARLINNIQTWVDAFGDIGIVTPTRKLQNQGGGAVQGFYPGATGVLSDGVNIYRLPADWELYLRIYRTNHTLGGDYRVQIERLLSSIPITGIIK